MRRGFAFVWLLITALIAGITGYIAYGAGWSAALATKLPDAGAVVYPPYYWGYGWGAPFGFVGFLFFLLIGFLIFRFLFFGMWFMRGGHRGRYDRFEEWHKSQHSSQPPTTTTV